MLKTASIGIPVRLVAPEPIPHVQKRPTVDVPGIASRAANEVIQTLAEWQEQQAKAGKSFLKRRQPRPEIDLVTVAESLKEAIMEAYRVSAARCEPAILTLTEEHLTEIQQLQDKAVELFCRDMLRVVGDDSELKKQVYELCPALKPAPEPDKVALAELQKQMDRAMAAVMSLHEDLIMVLREMDNLTREEAQALAGTNQAGNGRIRRQAEHAKCELVRLLERQEICKSMRIPAARWE